MNKPTEANARLQELLRESLEVHKRILDLQLELAVLQNRAYALPELVRLEVERQRQNG